MNAEWPKIRLGEIITPIERAEIPIPGIAYRQLGVRLWGEGAYEREILDGAQTKYARLFRAESGDIIVNKIWARNGSVAVVPPSLAGCYGSGEFPMFVPNPDRLDSKWMKWLTKSPDFWAQCDEKSRGTSGKNRIRPEKFLEIEISLPGLLEQRQIVAHIESVAEAIDEAQNLRREAIKDVNMLWQRRAAQIFERLEEKSPICHLGEAASMLGGGTPSKTNPFFWSGTIPWVTPKDMKVLEIYDSTDHITEQAIEASPAKIILPGAVLAVVRGMILAHTFPSAILRVAATINQDMKALIPRGCILPEYLCALLWAFNDRIVGMVEKSTHDTRKLRTEKLLDLQIPMPAIEEQRQIVKDLDVLRSETNFLRRLQAETAIELDVLLPSIFDRAFRGELFINPALPIAAPA